MDSDENSDGEKTPATVMKTMGTDENVLSCEPGLSSWKESSLRMQEQEVQQLKAMKSKMIPSGINYVRTTLEGMHSASCSQPMAARTFQVRKSKKRLRDQTL
jgi:hypothetical protein